MALVYVLVLVNVNTCGLPTTIRVYSKEAGLIGKSFFFFFPEKV